MVLTQNEMILALQARVAALEKKLGLPGKTPDNSGVPPLHGVKPGLPRKPKGRRRKGRPGRHRALDPAPTRVLDLRAARCPSCRADVSGVAQELRQACDHIDIPPIAPDVTRVHLHGGTCPHCAARFKASPPAAMPPGSPFGPRLRALAIHLRFVQNIALGRLARLMRDLYGLAISEGALVNMFRAAAPAFAAQRADLRAGLPARPVLASDETGLRAAGRNHWLWVVHHGDSAVFLADPSRGKRVLTDFLGDHRPDFRLSDRYGGQRGLARLGQQFCLPHLIRDARYAEQAGDTVLAPGLIALFQRACRLGRVRDRFTDAQLTACHRKFVKALSLLLEREPVHPEGIKLRRVIGAIRGNLFLFVENRALDPTNNGSERALRPCVTFRKIIQGFRTPGGADLFASVRSTFETARRRAMGPLDAILMTLAGKPLQPP